MADKGLTILRLRPGMIVIPVAEGTCKAHTVPPDDGQGDDSDDPTSVDYRAPHSNLAPSAIEAILAGNKRI